MKRVHLVSMALALASSACLAACRAGEPTAAAAETQRGPIAVGVAPVVGKDVPVIIDATGSFAAAESSDVAPEVSGLVIATPVDVGTSVKKGDVLVRLRGVDASLKLNEAQAAAKRAAANVSLAESQNALAQITSQRYENLLATGDVSRTVAEQARTQAETNQQTVLTSRASLAEAQAQLALAQKALGDVVVRAPFPGFISERKVSVGEYVQPMNPVVTLVEIDPLRLVLTVPGVQAGHVAVGQLVVATVDAFPERRFTGTMTAIAPSIDPQSRAFTAEARVSNPDAALKPGMFAVASIDQGRTERAWFVPKAAVLEDVNTDSFRVFVIDDQNIAHLRVVQLDARSPTDPTRVMRGVAEGERVATTALADLYDGATVAIGQTSLQPSTDAETR